LRKTSALWLAIQVVKNEKDIRRGKVLSQELLLNIAGFFQIFLPDDKNKSFAPEIDKNRQVRLNFQPTIKTPRLLRFS
jgi:hypothetical protein